MNEESDNDQRTTTKPEGVPSVSPVAALGRDFSWLDSANDSRGSAESGSGADGTAGPPEEEAGLIERLGFRVADLHIVCPFEWVSEVSSVPAIYRIPNLPPWMLGGSNLRGNVVPIANLARYLGLKSRPEKNMLVVFGREGDRFGILVDSQPDIYSFLPQQRLRVVPPVPEGLRPHLVTAYETQGVIWLEADIRALFDGAAQ